MLIRSILRWKNCTRAEAWWVHYGDVIMSTLASQITSLTVVYSTVYSGSNKKTSKLHITGLCEGNSPVTGEFPAQRASDAENVSIWWRHHGFWPSCSPRVTLDSNYTEVHGCDLTRHSSWAENVDCAHDNVVNVRFLSADILNTIYLLFDYCQLKCQVL